MSLKLDSPSKWAKRNCPNKHFVSLQVCEVTKCPHVVYKDEKLYGCELWMKYTNQTDEAK